jgi:predicted nuclease of predicted toxin-antitoxin system
MLMPWRKVLLPSDREVAAFWREHRKKTRLLVDESLGAEVANVLRSAGWNTRYVADVGLQGHSDEDVLAFAQRDDRILLSHDTDFLDDRRFPPHRNPGVIILPGGSGDEAGLGRALGRALSVVGHLREVYRGAKVGVSSDGTITIRNRDFNSGAMQNTRYRFARDGSLEEWYDDAP